MLAETGPVARPTEGRKSVLLRVFNSGK